MPADSGRPPGPARLPAATGHRARTAPRRQHPCRDSRASISSPVSSFSSRGPPQLQPAFWRTRSAARCAARGEFRPARPTAMGQDMSRWPSPLSGRVPLAGMVLETGEEAAASRNEPASEAASISARSVVASLSGSSRSGGCHLESKVVTGPGLGLAGRRRADKISTHSKSDGEERCVRPIRAMHRLPPSCRRRPGPAFRSRRGPRGTRQEWRGTRCVVVENGIVNQGLAETRIGPHFPFLTQSLAQPLVILHETLGGGRRKPRHEQKRFVDQPNLGLEGKFLLQAMVEQVFQHEQAERIGHATGQGPDRTGTRPDQAIDVRRPGSMGRRQPVAQRCVLGREAPGEPGGPGRRGPGN